MAILYKEYQDILGINPKYRTAISSLNEKQLEAYSTIVNLCANSILHYDEIKAIPYHEYTFGIGRTKDKSFTCLPFSVRTINYYGGVSVAGATMRKLVNLGLLEKTGKYGDSTGYRIPVDLFTTNDLSIKFYNPDIPKF